MSSAVRCGLRAAVASGWVSGARCCTSARSMATDSVGNWSALAMDQAAESPISTSDDSTPTSTITALPKITAFNATETEFMQLALSKATADQLTTAGTMEVLERSTTQAVVATLLSSAAAGAAEDIPRIALVGDSKGVGKSVGLASIAQQCKANGWVVAYVPNASTWCDGLQSIETSKRDETRLDQYAASARWLTQFVTQNGSTLANIKVSGSYEWDTPLNSSGLDTLQSLAQFGITALDSNGEGDPTIACDVVGVVLKELRREDLGVPVLVAVDVYNAWLRESFPKFKDFDSVVVTRERASLIRHFLKITEAVDSRPIAAGAVVVAASDNGGTVAPQDMSSFATSMYTRFSDTEVHALLRHFATRGYLPHDLTKQQRSVLQLIISSNPRQFRKHLSSL